MIDGRILVVDDEEDMLEVCRDMLAPTGAHVETESDPRRALQRLCSESFDVAVLDVRMPGLGGLELLQRLRSSGNGPGVVLITAFASPESVEQSIRGRAEDYVTKPFSADQFLSAVTRALVRRRQREDVARPPGPCCAEPFDGMVGVSERMRSVFALIEQVAPTSIDVLVTGESGTGKELIARSIHRRSRRASARFVPVDCGAIPETLLESELFGHEKGAFTGATAAAVGLIEFAHQGTLFLDEVGDLALSLQAKLLRALQERQIRRVGGKELIAVDVRVIAATNKDLLAEMRAGRFRDDLYYRLHAIQIDVPTLRSRRSDIALLLELFLERAAQEAGKAPLRAEPEAVAALERYSWPGNVRELLNVARRASIMSRDGVLRLEDLPAEISQGPADPQAAPPADFFLERSIRMRDFERQYISELLQRHRGDVHAAAAEARLPRGTLYRLMKKHGLASDRFRAGGPSS